MGATMAPSELDALTSSILRGNPLPETEAATLVDITNDGLPALCAAASELRDQGKGRTVTFSPKVFIPLTMLCRDFCGYCTFRRDPESAGDLYMSPEQVLKVAKAGQALGCTEALFTLGERPEQR